MLRKISNVIRHPAHYIHFVIDKTLRQLRPVVFRFTVKHIFGPQQIPCKEDGCIVLCVVRDGEEYVESFIKYYLALGVDHIVFLDNGSTDKTLDIARRFPKTSIFTTTASFRHYKTPMKRYLTSRFARHNWGLLVDIDEFFDYPQSDRVPLNKLLQYLNQHGFTAVMGYMLDMFSTQSLSEVLRQVDRDFRALDTYYDLTNISKTHYPQPTNIVSNPGILWYEGGIRTTVLGVEGNVITKNPLLIFKGKQRLLNPHQVAYARIADISCVLYHYKFTHRFMERTDEAVRLENYVAKSKAYKLTQAVFRQNPDVTLYRETAQKLTSVQALVDQDFLAVSDQYLAWAESQSL